MRILVAEDDHTTALLLTRVLRKAGHEVVRAEDGSTALELARNDGGFDVILTDWMMPKLDGVAFIQAARRDVVGLPPIVMITSAASNEARERALDAGADDYLAKPVQSDELTRCLESAVGRHRQTWKPVPVDAVSGRADSHRRLPAPLVVLTAGTGGPMALQKIFRSLVGGSQACFVIVQQGPHWMLETFARRLQSRTSLPVALAADGEPIMAGRIRIAPGGVHCVVDEDKACLRLTDTAPVNFLKPAADVLFRSAARFGQQCIGVILSGLGCDGAMGAELIRVASGRILVQEPRSAEVASMPQAAVDHGKPDVVLPLDAVAATLDAWIGELHAGNREGRP